MSLNIKNEQTHRLVRELAERTGQSQTSAVEDAVRRRLLELDHESRRERVLDEIDEIVARTAPLFVGMTAKEAMDGLFDAETGLPR